MTEEQRHDEVEIRLSELTNSHDQLAKFVQRIDSRALHASLVNGKPGKAHRTVDDKRKIRNM